MTTESTDQNMPSADRSVPVDLPRDRGDAKAIARVAQETDAFARGRLPSLLGSRPNSNFPANQDSPNFCFYLPTGIRPRMSGTSNASP